MTTMTRGQVLAIDDDYDCLVMVQHMLRQMGFAVTAARSGQEALALVGSVQPDVILLDLLMPDMDGFTVLDKLKSAPSTRSIPVVIVSARGHDDDLLAGYVAGADYYVSKPFTSSQLLYGIEMVIGERAAAMAMVGEALDDVAPTREH